MTRCPACGFQWVAEWEEAVKHTAPPIWWELPLELWEPQWYVMSQSLCTQCGELTQSAVT